MGCPESKKAREAREAEIKDWAALPPVIDNPGPPGSPVNNEITYPEGVCGQPITVAWVKGFEKGKYFTGKDVYFSGRKVFLFPGVNAQFGFYIDTTVNALLEKKRARDLYLHWIDQTFQQWIGISILLGECEFLDKPIAASISKFEPMFKKRGINMRYCKVEGVQKRNSAFGQTSEPIAARWVELADMSYFPEGLLETEKYKVKATEKDVRDLMRQLDMWDIEKVPEGRRLSDFGLA